MSRIPEDIGQYVSYDPTTGVMCRIAPARQGAKGALGPITNNQRGYFGFQFRGQNLRVHRVAFFLMTGREPDIVDHRDGNTTNNAWANLREADPSQSSANRKGFGPHKKGVRPSKGSRWRACIKFRGQRVGLGCFDTEDEAHAAYRAAAHRLHGEFARVE
ncbi:MAG: HNH endonuclease [Nitrobacter sp.]